MTRRTLLHIASVGSLIAFPLIMWGLILETRTSPGNPLLRNLLLGAMFLPLLLLGIEIRLQEKHIVLKLRLLAIWIAFLFFIIYFVQNVVYPASL